MMSSQQPHRGRHKNQVGRSNPKNQLDRQNKLQVADTSASSISYQMSELRASAKHHASNSQNLSPRRDQLQNPLLSPGSSPAQVTNSPSVLSTPHASLSPRLSMYRNIQTLPPLASRAVHQSQQTSTHSQAPREEDPFGKARLGDGPGHSSSHLYQPLPSLPPLPSLQQDPPPKRVSGVCFLVAVIHVIAFEYIGYVLVLLLPLLYPRLTWVGGLLTIVFHMVFFMTLAAFIQCVQTDPGTVPPNWGFYLGDKNKRRRYCRRCNIWKPDRTHHCSTCGRCVLNMDHHCPWINNCVGFYNRKFFIQLLCWALLSLLFVIVHGFWYICQRGFLIWPYTKLPTLQYALDIGSYCTVCVMLFVAIVLGFPLVPFLRFHWGLITRNSTTVENMVDPKRGNSPYDLGTRRNIEQVLGNNILLWWFPFHTLGSRPAGDGVRWRQFYLIAVENEV